MVIEMIDEAGTFRGRSSVGRRNEGFADSRADFLRDIAV